MTNFHDLPPIPDIEPKRPPGTCKTCGYWDWTGDGRGRCLVDGMGYLTYPDDGCAEWRRRERL